MVENREKRKERREAVKEMQRIEMREAVKLGLKKVIGPFLRWAESLVVSHLCCSHVRGESTAVCVSTPHMASRTRTQLSHRFGRVRHAYGTHFEEAVLPSQKCGRASASHGQAHNIGDIIMLCHLKFVHVYIYYVLPDTTG